MLITMLGEHNRKGSALLKCLSNASLRQLLWQKSRCIRHMTVQQGWKSVKNTASLSHFLFHHQRALDISINDYLVGLQILKHKNLEKCEVLKIGKLCVLTAGSLIADSKSELATLKSDIWSKNWKTPSLCAKQFEQNVVKYQMARIWLLAHFGTTAN